MPITTTTVDYSDGTTRWYLGRELHRLDGPAIEWADGKRDWYIRDIRFTIDEFLLQSGWARDKQMLYKLTWG